ncbi:MAG: hypothetical protein H8K07_23355 [Nitrospira sp.]|nr:hypothetical protein [Nitrospira sp.]
MSDRLLEGKRVGPEQESFLGGKVVGTNTGDLHNYTIEFINQAAAQSWRSGKITLSAEGAFLATLWAEKGLLNRFEIELHDATGTLCNTTPNYWQYEVGSDLPDQLLIHSLGIATPDGSFHVFLRKACVLPASCTKRFSTRTPFVKGQSVPFLSLALYEGEEARADHNRHIGELRVGAEDIHQDLSAGTEVELTIAVDESRLVRSMVFIPILDAEFTATIQLAPPPNLDEVHNTVKEETARFERLRRTAEETNCGTALGMLEHGQHSLQELDRTLQRARFDRDAISECDSRLRRLRSTLNEVESIIQAQKQEREHLAEQAFLIDGLNALYGRHPNEGAQ